MSTSSGRDSGEDPSVMDAQAEYDHSPQLRELLARAAASATVHRPTRHRQLPAQVAERR